MTLPLCDRLAQNCEGGKLQQRQQWRTKHDPKRKRPTKTVKTLQNISSQIIENYCGCCNIFSFVQILLAVTRVSYK